MKVYIGYVKALINKELPEADTASIEIPPDPRLGDFAFPCFSLAKQMRKPPAEIAKELAFRIQPQDPVAKIVAQGPYLNFFIDDLRLSSDVLKKKGLNIDKAAKKLDKINNERSKASEKKKIMVEYSSPNTNKPLHLGHLRNIFLGKIISNISRYTGEDVVEACVINDRGIHICKSMLAYKKFGESRDPDKKPDHFVGDFYVLFNRKAKEDPGMEEEAKDMLRKWEEGDKETLKLWRRMNSWAIEGFEETYQKLNVHFDKYYYESELFNGGKDIIHDGLKKGIFVEDDGAVIADMESEGLGKKVLIRGDGTALYMTQDIYQAKKKFEDFDLDESIYVVASEQNLHFRQLFKILEMLGLDLASRCFHLSYGMVYLPEGKMKSREGTVVDADNIIQEMIDLAKVEVQKRHKVTDDELEKRAEAIGLGALRFYLLKTDPQKDMTYDPKESISFEGETGPYVQYSYARIASILRKADTELRTNVNRLQDDADISLYVESEMLLIRKIASSRDFVEDARKNYKPSIICRYLLGLCQQFNEYYHSTPVLNADKSLRDARLLLIHSVQQTIKQCLKLLDIDVLEEM